MTDQVHQPRELTEQVRRHIYRTNGTLPLLFATGAAWLVSGLYALFGVDLFKLLGHHGDNDATPSWLYLTLAIVVPLGTGIWAWFKIRNAIYLAQYGVEVPARVTSVGFGIRGMCHVYYEYNVGPRVIDGKMSMGKEIANKYQSGEWPFVLMVDPDRPEKFMEKNDVLPRAGKWNWWSGYH